MSATATPARYLREREALIWVPNAALRALAQRAVDEELTTWRELAVRCGYANSDSSALRRSLGIDKDTGGHTGRTRRAAYHRTHMRYETAVALVRELGAYPVDYGV